VGTCGVAIKTRQPQSGRDFGSCRMPLPRALNIVALVHQLFNMTYVPFFGSGVHLAFSCLRNASY
jgi:hypothetical protein